MAEAAPKTYKGKNGQAYQLYFKDEEDEDDDVRTLTTSPVDPYSDLNIHPPMPGVSGNPFKTTVIKVGAVSSLTPGYFCPGR